MKRFVIRENIRRFREMLAADISEARREMIDALLQEAIRELAYVDASTHRPETGAGGDQREPERAPAAPQAAPQLDWGRRGSSDAVPLGSQGVLSRGPHPARWPESKLAIMPTSSQGERAGDMAPTEALSSALP